MVLRAAFPVYRAGVPFRLTGISGLQDAGFQVEAYGIEVHGDLAPVAAEGEALVEYGPWGVVLPVQGGGRVLPVGAVPVVEVFLL